MISCVEDCQQVSKRGGNLQGQAQHTVTAAGRRAGYVQRLTDCIICCPLVCCLLPFIYHTLGPGALVAAAKLVILGLLLNQNASYTILCLLHLLL